MNGGRSGSHPRKPRVRIKLVSGTVKFTNGWRFVVGAESGNESFCRVQEMIDQLRTWLVKGEYVGEGTLAAGVSRPWVQGTE